MGPLSPQKRLSKSIWILFYIKDIKFEKWVQIVVLHSTITKLLRQPKWQIGQGQYWIHSFQSPISIWLSNVQIVIESMFSLSLRFFFWWSWILEFFTVKYDLHCCITILFAASYQQVVVLRRICCSDAVWIEMVRMLNFLCSGIKNLAIWC